MKIGAYEIHSIETGRFGLDGGAMFGVVPRVLWSKTNPPDERNRITLAARCLLLTGNGKVILIDDGNGSKFTDKLKDIYKLDNSRFTLEGSLGEYGVHPSDITDVILTHLHFDHAGGSTMIKDGKVIPSFPNATYYVQRQHWDAATHPTERDRGSFMKEDFMILNEAGQLALVEGESEFLPGVGFFVCNGHTAAQQLPKISDERTTLLFCCDLVPTASHLPFPYIMGYDLRPLVTLEEKKRILSQAAEGKWIVFLEHDPDREAFTLKPGEKGFIIDQEIRVG